MAERFAFYGLVGNLITFLTNHLHQPTVTAVKNINTWVGVSSVFPILGALVADSYLGRFTTILLASLIYFAMQTLVGLVVCPWVGVSQLYRVNQKREKKVVAPALALPIMGFVRPVVFIQFNSKEPALPHASTA